MPMLSTEISSLTGGFNQQVMLQQQQSSMISQQFGGYAPNPFAGQGSSFGERMSSNTLGVSGKIGQGIMDVGSRFTGPLGWAGSGTLSGRCRTVFSNSKNSKQICGSRTTFAIN